jgi:glycosyltransferase involved in cell wall biosynthesis
MATSAAGAAICPAAFRSGFLLLVMFAAVGKCGFQTHAGTLRLQLKTLIPRAMGKRWKKIFGRSAPPRPLGQGSAAQPARAPRDVKPITAPSMPIEFGPVRLLSAAPPVFLSGIPYDEYLGIANAFAQRYGNMRCGFIIFPTWSIDNPRHPPAIRQKLSDHSRRYPNHRFLFICNTPREAQLLEEHGLPATFLNKNIMVSDRTFRPIPGPDVEFDAVYNARFVQLKRHELAAAVPRVGYVSYVEDAAYGQEFKNLYAAALARNPDHVVLNELVDGLPTHMSQEQVNAALGRAAVGLVLSKVEGSSYASMEYLLAGLPVVSTPSKGGRDVFFDPDYCIVCPPEPAAVRDAVAALRSRNIPREVIRARTLARIEPERRRFLAAVDDLVEQLGGMRRYDDGGWPFGDISGVPWRTFALHLEEFAAARGPDLAEQLGPAPT